MAQSRACHESELHAVRDAAVVLAPRHFVGILIEILTADTVMDPIFGPPQAAKIALRLIDARSIVSHVFLTMIDSARVVGCVQPLPGVRFVGMNDRAGSDV